VGLSWSSLTAAEWVQGLQASRLVTQHELPVRRLTNPAEVAAALAAGPTRWLAVINPYGEVFPSQGAGRWREMLDAVRRYVDHGGSWWETGGYSFHTALSPAPGGGWRSEPVGPSGLSHLGLPIGSGEVEAPAEELSVPEEGRVWLGETLARQVSRLRSPVNRSLPRGAQDPGHVTLVAGAGGDLIGGYRLGGWGWLWRVGGFNPEPAVVLPTAVAALEHLYTQPTLPRKAGGVRYLWHAVIGE
jgi:hypothetical protein